MKLFPLLLALLLINGNLEAYPKFLKSAKRKHLEMQILFVENILVSYSTLPDSLGRIKLFDDFNATQSALRTDKEFKASVLSNMYDKKKDFMILIKRLIVLLKEIKKKEYVLNEKRKQKSQECDSIYIKIIPSEISRLLIHDYSLTVPTDTTSKSKKEPCDYWPKFDEHINKSIAAVVAENFEKQNRSNSFSNKEVTIKACLYFPNRIGTNSKALDLTAESEQYEKLRDEFLDYTEMMQNHYF